MRFEVYSAFLALSASVSGHDLHLATKGLLQIPPSFARDGVMMYPGHRPGHDPGDLDHLKPHHSKELYYSQEGHRPALIGAKHGSLEAKFVHPTVVLDHSSHIRDIKCSQHHIDICFTPESFSVPYQEWKNETLILSTYHLGCGDETGAKRSFFRVNDPSFNPSSGCVRVISTPITEEAALDKGRITWGTFTGGNRSKRAPMKGHVRVVRNETPSMAYPSGTDQQHASSDVDLMSDGEALKRFFEDPTIDTSNMQGPVDPALEPDFISLNGSLASRSVDGQHIHKRGLNILSGLWNGLEAFCRKVDKFFDSLESTINTTASVITKFAIFSAQIIMVPFGVPFDRSYHADIAFREYVSTREIGNRPPPVFGHTEGFNLASSGSIWSIQCAKCGIQADFTVDGELAFSIKDGLTKGKVVLTNNQPFTIDAQFGITVEGQLDKAFAVKKQIAAVPISPLAIPGIITLGPQASISAALDFVLNGQAKLLLGGSFSVSPGVAALSLVDKSENKLEGLGAQFTPVFKAEGSLTATVELGLPIAIEIGLDVLNGKFKKTVGLVDKPSIYASASHSITQDRKCDGIELRAGVKNRLYVAALDMWDYDIRTDILYEKGIGCLTRDGFDTSAVESDKSVFTTVPQQLGSDVLSGDSGSNLTDIAKSLKPPRTDAGFRVIMDAKRTSILVSGEDGYIYLAETKENYDVSAPWGTINQTANAINLDVFGRLMSNRVQGGVATVKVHDVDRVPEKWKAASLSVLETQENSSLEYGVMLTVAPKETTPGYNPDFDFGYDQEDNKMILWNPTFCQTDKGLRLYATRLVYSQTLLAIDPTSGKSADDMEVFSDIGFMARAGIAASTCRTVQLTSQVMST